MNESVKKPTPVLLWLMAVFGLGLAISICGQNAKGPIAAPSEEPERSPSRSKGLRELSSVTTFTHTPRSSTTAAATAEVSAATLGNSSARTNLPGLSAAAEQILKLQLALLREGLSPGSLDGVWGSQTRAAVRAFQQKHALPATGDLDESTRPQLAWSAQCLTNYLVTTNDTAGLRPLGKTWLAKSQQDSLAYETILELVAEKSFSSPNLIRRLNPELQWSAVPTGALVQVPQTEFPPVDAKAAFVRILLSEKVLQSFDKNTNLLAHFPCSIAQRMEKRPVGELHVAVAIPNPNYTFDPELFPESAEGLDPGRKLILQPGPNNPVGTVWIGLDRSGYGIHGTPQPEQVGRTESHGCFRLANWNAEHLLKLVWVGMPVYVEP
jgi:lipoprotein-anchoring transpeptidase ErfK/SrfK